MYSNSGANELANDDKKWSKNGHYYGIGVKYQANAIKSSLIFEATQNKNSLLGAVDQKGEAGVVTTEEKIKNHSAKYGINYGFRVGSRRYYSDVWISVYFGKMAAIKITNLV